MKKFTRRAVALCAAAVMSLSLVACGKKNETTKDGYAKEIYLYNWTEYMTQDVLDKFEDEYGIKVIETTFESNDEMLAKLLAGNSGEFDVVVPTGFYIDAMRENDLLEELDKDKLTNLSNVDPEYQGKSYDPENKYTVPYMGTVCVWVGNKKQLAELGIEVHKMSDLMQDELKGKIVIADDAQANIGIGLMSLGYDPLSTDLNEIEEAKDYLLELNPYVKAYAPSTEVRDTAARGEAPVSYMYSGDALQAMAVNDDLVLIMDEEQISMSIDNFVIAKGSKHKVEAELFINFLLRPEIAAELTEYCQYVSTNQASYELLSDELKESELVILEENIKKRLYYIVSFDGEAIAAEVDAMTEVKTAR